jgi:muramoyltetrapeptide carboxypeptidase
MSKKIIYPSVGGESLCIGVTAPSSGLGLGAFIKRHELIVDQLKQRGIQVIEGKCLRENGQHVSASKKERALDFLEQWSNQDIDLIQPPWGGERLIDILEYIDFDKLSDSPKWIQGYSDISTLLFAITTTSGIATAHGTNFIDSVEGQDILTSQSRDYLRLQPGDSFEQHSSRKWQMNFTDFSEKADATFNHTEGTRWKLLEGKATSFSGRMIGGCIDTIMHLIGTRYGNISMFSEIYAKDEGLILFLENCDMLPTDLYRALTSMKYAGWFDNVNGLVFGRNNGKDSDHFSYLDCISSIFDEYSFPIVLDADIGHKPPQMTIINGTLGFLRVEAGKATLIQKLI